MPLQESAQCTAFARRITPDAMALGYAEFGLCRQLSSLERGVAVQTFGAARVTKLLESKIGCADAGNLSLERLGVALRHAEVEFERLAVLLLQTQFVRPLEQVDGFRRYLRWGNVTPLGLDRRCSRASSRWSLGW